MEIFVLVGEFEYESHHVLGVYSSEEEAINAKNIYVRDEDKDFHHYYVEQRSLGAPVDDDIFEGRYI